MRRLRIAIYVILAFLFGIGFVSCVKTGLQGGSGEPEEESKNVYELIVQRGYTGTTEELLASLAGEAGDFAKNGSIDVSAYKVAVGKGYSGTEDEWTELLFSASGIDWPPDMTGNDEVNSSNRDSVFKKVLQNGYKGSLSEWLTDLMGEYVAYENNGIYDTNRITVYELAVSHGFKGSFPEWLELLVSGDDATGKTPYELIVENGYKGDLQGWLALLVCGDISNGGDHLSVYEILIENGYVGTESEWISILVGDIGYGQENGITPQLRINSETSKWEVSFDNGVTWDSLNISLGDSDNTEGGQAIAHIAGAYVDEKRHLWIVLSDGTRIDTGYVHVPTTGAPPESGDETQKSAFLVSFVKARADETVEVSVSIKNNPGVAGAKLRISYDTGMTLIGAVEGPAFESIDYTAPADLRSGCAFNWDSLMGEATEDGEVLLLTFRVSDRVSVGDVLEIACSYSHGDVYGDDLENVYLDCISGSVTILE